MKTCIRLITLDDLNDTRNIYKHYVETSAISFEYVPPELHEWKEKVTSIWNHYPWLVYEVNSRVVGYAYASKHRNRTAYDWSTEATIYMDENFHGTGAARILYQTLFKLLRLQGYINVIAAITVPNEKSEHFHQRLGFYEIGTCVKIGFKFGEWHDTKLYQMHLADHPLTPHNLKTIADVCKNRGIPFGYGRSQRNTSSD